VPAADPSFEVWAQCREQVSRNAAHDPLCPGTIVKSDKRRINGNPDMDRLCTSHIESFNQNFRAHLKRFARLTAAHSKSAKHYEAMQAVYFLLLQFLLQT
jgi:IS1 family transposase